MRRPAGEPGTIAADARGMGAAAGALRRSAGGCGARPRRWSPPGPGGARPARRSSSTAALQTGLDRAAEALDQAAGALSELAARLD
ncbi:MAG: hypothetical protein ACJ75K_29155, partial [Actinomycetes bacterium]